MGRLRQKFFFFDYAKPQNTVNWFTGKKQDAED
jgi:hypothetical protein